MRDWLPLLLGLLTGILSAWGLGGGTLLLLLLELFLQTEPAVARGANLLYFLPVAGLSLLQHRKNGYLEAQALRWAAPSCALGALLAARLALRLETGLLRRPFGLLLLLAAGSLLRKKKKKPGEPASS